MKNVLYKDLNDSSYLSINLIFSLSNFFFCVLKIDKVAILQQIYKMSDNCEMKNVS